MDPCPSPLAIAQRVMARFEIRIRLKLMIVRVKVSRISGYWGINRHARKHREDASILTIKIWAKELRNIHIDNKIHDESWAQLQLNARHEWIKEYDMNWFVLNWMIEWAIEWQFLIVRWLKTWNFKKSWKWRNEYNEKDKVHWMNKFELLHS